MIGTPPASGVQNTLQSGPYRAEIAGTGATLRSLRYRDRDLIVPFDADALRPAMRGAIMVPWPNRTADGRYSFGGDEHQLPLNEVETGNASHGLVAWRDFAATDVSPKMLALACELEPQPGYPWRLRVEVRFEVDNDGLSQEVTVTNLSDAAAPVGIGGHPYLLAGPARENAVDAWHLTVPADRILRVSADRLLPVAVEAVEESDAGARDFRSGRVLGSTQLNHAFTGLLRDDNGLARMRVVAPDGSGAEISWDERAPWVQLYTAEASSAEGYRHAVAVEPMTCPPDALNSRQDLLIVAPGEAVSAGWCIRAIAARDDAD
ncbi:aldose 1-epimerase family protein [Microbacterium sp. JZ70]